MGTCAKYGTPITVAITLSASSASPQAVEIQSAVSCGRCAVVIEQVADLAGVFYEGPPTLITRGPNGEFFMLDAEAIKAFGRTGGFRFQIGRRGGGPGEYQRPRNLLVARDGSIHLLDVMLARYTVFSPAGKFRSMVPTTITRGIGMDAVFLPDGQLVVNGIFSTPNDAGYALLRIDRSGRATHRFDEGPFVYEKPWLQRRLLWARSNGELLVAKPYSFDIDVYSAGLQKQTTLRRVAEWVPSSVPDENPSDGVFDQRPTPRLASVWEDADGLIWLVALVPSPRWKSGPRVQPGKLPPREEYDALERRPRYDTIIEVVDLTQRQVVARSRIAGEIGQAFGGGYIATNIESAQGDPTLRISRLRLKR